MNLLSDWRALRLPGAPGLATNGQCAAATARIRLGAAGVNDLTEANGRLYGVDSTGQRNTC